MKRKKKYRVLFYRNVLIEINGTYSFGSYKVVVHTPDVERYFKGMSGVRSCIDTVLNKGITNKGIPSNWR